MPSLSTSSRNEKNATASTSKVHLLGGLLEQAHFVHLFRLACLEGLKRITLAPQAGHHPETSGPLIPGCETMNCMAIELPSWSGLRFERSTRPEISPLLITEHSLSRLTWEPQELQAPQMEEAHGSPLTMVCAINKFANQLNENMQMHVMSAWTVAGQIIFQSLDVPCKGVENIICNFIHTPNWGLGNTLDMVTVEQHVRILQLCFRGVACIEADRQPLDAWTGC
ncbi:hypothetical protein GY45DRAFT_1340835 [Cubamyces sp. BRFM 1775]|nr:hypothetical protein GY45DRAFT_1340835 [Cubamyces sp. BRFM 1775]